MLAGLSKAITVFLSPERSGLDAVEIYTHSAPLSVAFPSLTNNVPDVVVSFIYNFLNKKHIKNQEKRVSGNISSLIRNTKDVAGPKILLNSNPKKIYIDKLQNYQYLISKEIHSTQKFSTNSIERKNLSIRTHLKRLNRGTICFSKNLLILSSILKIYF